MKYRSGNKSQQAGGLLADFRCRSCAGGLGAGTVPGAVVGRCSPIDSPGSPRLQQDRAAPQSCSACHGWDLPGVPGAEGQGPCLKQVDAHWTWVMFDSRVRAVVCQHCSGRHSLLL